MKRCFALLVLLVGFGTGCDLLFKKEPPPPVERSAAEIWGEKVASVEPGMTRGEVESILPAHTTSLKQRKVTGQEQVVSYWVDEEWKVSFRYDFTGSKQTAGGDVTYDSPQNKILAKPDLIREDLP